MKRKPILLSRHSVALIFMYNRNDEIFDIAAGAYNEFDAKEIYIEAAKEFVNQLEDRWSVNFMEALRDEIEIRIDNFIVYGKRNYE